MKNLIQAAVVILFAASTAQAQQAVQWKVSEGGNGHWYGYSLARLDWNAAEQAARVSGGHLATITSSAENAFVASLGLPSAPDLFLSAYWTGGRRPSAGAPFGWITGEPWSFTNWDGPEPNGCCGTDVRFVVFRVHAGSLGRWDDTSVNGNADAHPQWSLIEWSADCNNDGIVDYGQCRDGSLPDYNGNNIPDCCEGGTPCTVGNYPVQWRDTEGGNGHWYQKVGPFSSWEAARSACVAQGGHLMTITSQAEWDYVFFNIQPQPFGGTVLGGYQVPGSPEPGVWRWVTDEPWPSFINFASFDDCPGGPAGACGGTCFLPNQQDFLMFGWFGGTNPNQWFDDVGGDFTRDCGPIQRYAIIEWSADCNGDGIVDQGQILRGLLPDTNINGIPDLCETPDCYDADFFRDRFVNGADLGILLVQWGPNGQYTVSDLNHDGIVDANDLGIFLSLWGPCPY